MQPAAIVVCPHCRQKSPYYWSLQPAAETPQSNAELAESLSTEPSPEDAEQQPTQDEASVDLPASCLSKRQLQVLKLLAVGHSVKEVARQLHVANKTVESHKSRIMEALGLRDRVLLARYAIRQGLIEP